MSQMPESQLTRVTFAQTEPLTTRLHGLIRSYPRGIGLIQEFVQNADDAGATTVSIWLDERSFGTHSLPAATMSRLQGPGIVVTNDATFSDEDWRRLQTIGQSGKSLDSSKTGRFGLGFNSVYNVTDFPFILSRDQVGVFDPHGTTVAGASVQTPGGAWRLNEALWSGASDMLAPFADYGLEARATNYAGTAFRLPLRTAAQAHVSEICTEPFTSADFESIVSKLGARVGELFLFLNNVLCIEFGVVSADGKRRHVLTATTRNRDSVVASRSAIHAELRGDHEALLAGLRSTGDETHTTFLHELDVRVAGQKASSETWLITRGIFVDDDGEILDRAEEMFALEEKAIPSAGAASLVKGGSTRDPKGRVYCGLPLPLASPAPGCHIHGFFDLQADRQGLFEDPEADAGGAVRFGWNKALIAHGCAKALALHCAYLSRHALKEGQPTYHAWPHVLKETRNLLDHLPVHTYSHLSALKCISAGQKRDWLQPNDILIVPDGAPEELVTPLLADDFALPQPRLPRYVVAGFRACEQPLPVLSAMRLRDDLRIDSDCSFELEKAPRPCLRTRSGLVALLKHCVSDKDLDKLAGVPLAILASGQVCTFSATREQKVYLAGPEERALFSRHAHWFLDEEVQSVCELAVSVGAGILEFTPQSVLNNLHKVLPTIGEDSTVDPGMHTNPPSDEWLVRAFRYLAGAKANIKLDSKLIGKIPLVPDQFGVLHGLGLENTPLLASSDDQARLANALGYFNVPIVSGSKEVLSAIRAFVEAYPDDAIWRIEPRDLIDTMAAVDGPQTSEDGGDQYRKDRHGTVLDFLSSRVESLKKEAIDRVDKLRTLRLFPSASGEVVRLNEGNYYVPDSYELPDLETDIGLLECGTMGRWNVLYRVLDVPTLTRSRLVSDVLLPQLSNLSGDELICLARWMRHHLQEIREEESSDIAEALVHRLGSELPLVCTDNVNRSADMLYHPDADFVAALLGEAVGFPDLDVYSDRPELWLEFFATLGMAETPRADDIVSAIDRVLLSTAKFSVKVERLGEIAHYLDQHWSDLQDILLVDEAVRPNEADEWHLSDALSRRAWLPAVTTPPRGFPTYMLATHDEVFYKPSDIFARSALDLASSVHPVCAIDNISRLAASIGLRSEPELDSVLDQLVNLSQPVVISDDGSTPKRVGGMYRNAYLFFGRNTATLTADEIEEDDVIKNVRRRVCDCACIVDESLKLWRPAQCFEEPVHFLLGQGVRVRAENPELDRGLQVLGRRQTPNADDFHKLFSDLAVKLDNRTVAEDDLLLIRQAYRAAAGVAEPSELIDAPVLCDGGELVPSCEIVLDDAPWLSERIRASGVDTLDSQLDRRVAVAFGVRSLSSAVYESPKRETASGNTSFLNQCEAMEDRLRSTELLRGVKRLLAAADSAVRHDQLSSFFSDLNVIGVKELETTLVWLDGDIPVEGSDGFSDLLFHHNNKALVVAEDAEEVLADLIADAIVRELDLDGHSLGDMSAKFVTMLRVSPERIDGHLTKLHVPVLPDEDVEETTTLFDEHDGLIDEDVIDKASPEDAADALETSTIENTVDSETSDSEPDDEEPAGTIERPELSPSISIDTHNGQPRSTDGTEAEVVRHSTSTSGGDDGESVESAQAATDVDGDAKESEPENATDKFDGIHSSMERNDHGLPRSRGATESMKNASNSGRSRSSNKAGRGWTAVTRVTSESDRQSEESPERQEQRRRVDQAAIERVKAFELERGRRPNVMDHGNEGYDIESLGVNGAVERFIEVKGRSGPWTGFNVSYSRAQHRKAMHEKSDFWLYVVEFALERDRSRVFAIQDPAELIDQYWFDDGWKQLSKEQDGPGTGTRPKEGAGVIVDGNRKGRIKRIRSHGSLKHLQIEFEDGAMESLVYTPRRIDVVTEDEGQV